jgi:hypothetical protein
MRLNNRGPRCVLLLVLSGGQAGSPREGKFRVQSQFTVGITVEGKGDRIVVKAEDALIAALKVKAERPDALITYVRRLNRRGDLRHPPHGLVEKSN